MLQIFNKAVMTNAGANLLTRAQAGETSIQFTRMVTGDGVYAPEEKDISFLQQMAELKSEKNSYPISNVSTFSDHSVKVTAYVTNQNPATGEVLVTVGYYINEIGLYAKEKDGDSSTEVLYSIATISGDKGDFMPPYNGYNPAQIIQDYIVTVNNTAEITIQIGAGAVALAEDLVNLKKFVEESLKNIRVNVMVGATEEKDGQAGLVPAPTVEDAGKFLRADGTWAEIEIKGADGIPLQNCANLSLAEESDRLVLSWTDPDDIEFNGEKTAEWAGTKVVRKEGNSPESVEDGVLITDSTVRDQYAVEGLQDTDVVAGTQYHYTLFPYTTKNVYTMSDRNRVNGSVLNYNPVLEENSWEVIAQMSEEGLAKEIWKIGDKKGNYQIVGFNHDDLADGSGKAGITFIYWPTDLKSKWNDRRTDYTSILPFYEAYIYKDFLSGIYEGLEINLKSRIKEVIKECISVWDRTTYYATANKNMKLFLFSVKEMSKSGTDKLQNNTDGSYRVAIEGVNYEGLNTFSKDTWTRTPRYNSGDGQAIQIDGNYPFNLDIQLVHSVQYGFCV